MFQWLNKQGVSSDEGFTVQRMHRHFYHYVQGDHVMRAVVEPCRDPKSGRYFEEVSASSMTRWEAPYQSESVSEAQRESIKVRFLAALDFMGIEYIIV